MALQAIDWFFGRSFRLVSMQKKGVKYMDWGPKNKIALVANYKIALVVRRNLWNSNKEFMKS